MRHLALAVALAMLAVPALAAPIPITGWVLADQDPEAQGLANARIELFPAFERPADQARRLAGEEPAPLAAARTDADGTFEISAPGPGLYRLVLSADGRMPAALGELPVLEPTALDPVTPPAATPLEITVLGPDGRPRAGVMVMLATMESMLSSRWWYAVRRGVSGADGRLRLPMGTTERLLWFFVLTPGFLGPAEARVVDGRTTLRLAERPRVRLAVRDAGGEPVAGAVVHAGPPGAMGPVGATGEDGRFELALPAEEQGLWVEAPDGRAAEAKLAPGVRGEVEVRLAPLAEITGRVVGAATGEPLPGSLVWTAYSAAAGPVRTGPDGAFRLRVPDVDRAMVEAAAPRHHPFGALAVRRSGGFTPVRLELPAAAVIAGRVVDAAGRPVAGAVVVLRDRRPYGDLPPRASTGEDGSFIFPLRMPGLYVVTASREGYAPAVAEVSPPAPGRPAEPLRLVLTAGSTAVGTVVDQSGAPVAGAAVALEPMLEAGHQERWFDPERRPMPEVRAASDAEGRFTLRHVVPGHWDLVVARRGFAAARRPGVEVGAEAEPTDLGVVELEAGVVLEGLVTDAAGRPVAGAEVAPRRSESSSSLPGARDEPAGATVTTDAEGRFRLDDLRAGGRVDLEARHRDYLPGFVPGVDPATSGPVTLPLTTPRGLTGRVVGPEGEPVARAWVHAQGECSDPSERPRPSPWTAEDGSFQLERLRPGSCDVRVSRADYVDRTVRGLVVPADRDLAGVVVALERGAVVEGRALDADGAPVEVGSVSAWPQTDSSVQGAPIEEGRYRIEGLEPGRYRLEARSFFDESEASVEVDVGPGVTVRDFQLVRRAAVAGRVVDHLGTPVAGVSITLTSTSPVYRREQAVSAADGSFRITAASGRYDARAIKAGVGTAVHPGVEVAAGPVEGLELRLAPGGAIAGRIVGVATADLGSVRVRAFGGRESGPAVGVVDHEGRYRVPDLAPGEWRVEAELGPRRAGATVRLAPGEAEVVQDLELPGGPPLAGRVLLDGEPLAGAGVRGGSTGARTAHDGRFEIQGLRPGRHTLTVSGERQLHHQVTVELDEHREAVIEIATGRLTGRVVSATGVPLEGVDLAASRFLGRPVQLPISGLPRARSGADGTFEIPRLAAGSYVLTASLPGHQTATLTVEVQAGAVAFQEIRLAPAGEAPPGI